MTNNILKKFEEIEDRRPSGFTEKEVKALGKFLKLHNELEEQNSEFMWSNEDCTKIELAAIDLGKAIFHLILPHIKDIS